MADKYKRIPIDILPGTHPDATDSTTFGAVRCIDTDKVYFKRVDGQTYVRNIDPWVDFGAANDGEVQQAASVETEEDDMVGTPHTASWHYVDDVKYLIVGTSRKLYALSSDGGDVYDITPLRTTTDAIPNSLATSNGSKFLTVTHTAHGLSAGDYVKLSGAADTGGILAAQINRTFAVDVVDADTYVVATAGTASSTVSGGGGASVVVYRQVLPANIDRWSTANFGNTLLANPGGGQAIYEWNGDETALPTNLTNGPPANWMFVSNNAVVALGTDGQNNRIRISEIGNQYGWTAGGLSNSWQDDAEGVGLFRCAFPVRDGSLLFTENEVILLRFVDYPNLWDWEYVTRSDGIVSKRAVTEVEGVAYWIGRSGTVYRYDGAAVDTLPGNTCERLVRANAAADSFVRPMPEYKQVWFYVGDYYVIYDYEEGHFTSGTHDATAAENPARRLSANNRLVFARAAIRAGDGATVARVYELADSLTGDYASEDSARRKCYFRTGYRTLDDNRRADLREFALGYEGDTSIFTVTLTTKDGIHGTAGSGGMTAGPYTYNPENSVQIVDATGKYWSWLVEKNQASAFDTFTVGKMTEGVQPGVPL